MGNALFICSVMNYPLLLYTIKSDRKSQAKSGPYMVIGIVKYYRFFFGIFLSISKFHSAIESTLDTHFRYEFLHALRLTFLANIGGGGGGEGDRTSSRCLHFSLFCSFYSINYIQQLFHSHQTKP